MTILLRRPRGRNIRRTHPSEILNSSILVNSLRLAECSIATIDTLITSILDELCQSEGADQAAWFLGRDSRSRASYRSGRAGDLIERLGKLNERDLPWCRSHLNRGRAVMIKDLSELPMQASLDRTHLKSLGVHSLALIPVENGKLRGGVFALLSTKQSCHWSETLLGKCAIMGSMLMSAHARKMTGMQQETSDIYFREIFHNAAVGMAIEETSGRMLFVNDSLCRMFGHSEREMMRMSCRDFSHPEDYEREGVLFKDLLAGDRKSYEIEKRFFHRDGSIVWGKVHVTLLREYPNGSRVVLGIVEDITAQKDMLEKLVISQREVESLASRLILSQEEERRRVARELHDDIGQRLSMATSEVHALEKKLGKNGNNNWKLIESLAKDLDILVSDIHGLSHRLHSSQLQHLGITAALRDLCRQMGRSGLDVDLQGDDGLEPIPKDITLCLYRIAQEALTNTLNHSGEARASVILSKTADTYSMSIQDSGRGFEIQAEPRGLGLISMRERLKPLHGSLSLSSSPGKGTRIVVTIPRKDRGEKRGHSREAA
jgi:PAS domain S-box-containing protein